MSTENDDQSPTAETKPRGSLMWLGIAVLAVAACAVNAVLEQSLLMKVLSSVGAAVCLVIAFFITRDWWTETHQRK